jgi:hypothetical protein
VWGAFLWLVGAKVFRGGLSFMKAVEIAGLSAVVAALASVVRALLIMITGNLMASASPVLFWTAAEPGDPLVSYLGLLDVMVLWGLAIKALGVARLIRAGVVRVGAWICGGWFLWVGGLVTIGLLMQRLMGS